MNLAMSFALFSLGLLALALMGTAAYLLFQEWDKPEQSPARRRYERLHT